MSKKILLIENDAAIASELTRVLEARGLEVRVTGDGKEGLELARDGHPDAVVLCVELPRMSGYSVCQKLKKDEALRAIPVVLTSAEATEETFEAHRKLKARADDYLIKPYAPAALLAKLGALLHLPDAPAGGEEMVTLDDVEELSGEIPLIPEGERVRPSDALPAEDEDLRLLDNAFDSIAGEPRAEAPILPALRRPPDDEAAGADERPVGGEELRAAAELLPPEDEAVGHGEIDKLGEEADRALAALGAEGAGEDLAGGALGDEPPAAPPPPSGEPDAQRLRERVSELLIELAHSRDRAKGHEAELQTARAAAEREAQGRRNAEERLRQAEEAMRQMEERARQASERAAHIEERDRGASERVARLEEQLTALRLQAEETAQTASLKAAQVAALEAEASGLRSQLDAAQADLETSRAALDGTRDDAERRVTEAQKRLQELEAVNAKHEERIVKAYQKIKSDEKIREKTRKALAIALQLLDERIAATPPKEPGEPAPRRE